MALISYHHCRGTPCLPFAADNLMEFGVNHDYFAAGLHSTASLDLNRQNSALAVRQSCFIFPVASSSHDSGAQRQAFPYLDLRLSRRSDDCLRPSVKCASPGSQEACAPLFQQNHLLQLALGQIWCYK